MHLYRRTKRPTVVWRTTPTLKKKHRGLTLVAIGFLIRPPASASLRWLRTCLADRLVPSVKAVPALGAVPRGKRLVSGLLFRTTVRLPLLLLLGSRSLSFLVPPPRGLLLLTSRPFPSGLCRPAAGLLAHRTVGGAASLAGVGAAADTGTFPCARTASDGSVVCSWCGRGFGGWGGGGGVPCAVARVRIPLLLFLLLSPSSSSFFCLPVSQRPGRRILRERHTARATDRQEARVGVEVARGRILYYEGAQEGNAARKEPPQHITQTPLTLSNFSCAPRGKYKPVEPKQANPLLYTYTILWHSLYENSLTVEGFPWPLRPQASSRRS